MGAFQQGWRTLLEDFIGDLIFFLGFVSNGTRASVKT
jgi:hypothetical protein